MNTTTTDTRISDLADVVAELAKIVEIAIAHGLAGSPTQRMGSEEVRAILALHATEQVERAEAIIGTRVANAGDFHGN